MKVLITGGAGYIGSMLVGKGVVRGLHYQLKPAEQGKLIYVINGRVYDVAVDIRKGSPWFGETRGSLRHSPILNSAWKED